MFATSPLWLGFASGSYFTDAEPGSLRPVWVLSEWAVWRTGFRFPSTWTLNPTPPHLPESVTCYDEEQAVAVDGEKTVTLYSLITNAAYAAVFTNLSGLALPARFALRWPYPTVSHLARAQAAVVDEAVVETVTRVCQAHAFRPSLSGVVLISDCRLDKTHPGYAVQYIVTKGASINNIYN